MHKRVAKIVLSVILGMTLISAFSIEASAANTQVTKKSETKKKDPYADLAITKVSSSLNIRQKPSTTAVVVGKLTDGAVSTLLAEGKVWCKIKSGTVTGYVKKEFILTGPAFIEYANQVCKQKAVVTADTLRVRSKASTKGDVLKVVAKNTELLVDAVGIKWVRVDLNKKNGYVSKEYVTIDYKFTYASPVKADEPSIDNNDSKPNKTPAPTPVPTPAPNTDGNEDKITYPDISRQEIVDYALQFVGNPYFYGGTSLTNGADCSGFIYTIYGNFGAKLHRTSAMQSTNGIAVTKANLQPGDLIFYGKESITHVAMYIGSGRVVHAFNSKDGICTSDMNYGTIICMRSIIG